MTAPSRIAAFAVLLAAVFGVALLAGSVLHPEGGARATSDAGHGGAQMADGMAQAGGLRLVADRNALPLGATSAYRFRIVDAEGATVRDFALEHGKRLHLIVVRRDLTGYQHLHPTQRPDGSWTVPLRFTVPGTYRVFADFTPSGGEKTALSADVMVDGNATYAALPAPVARASVDGYDVTMAVTPAAGAMTRLTFTVSRGGRGGRGTIDLQPYLEARGHLVVLRADDLAYLHVHPESASAPDDPIAFWAKLPTAGRYRLFLQFKHAGRVHTVAFTQAVQ
jgi:hypothetical protein